MLHSSSLRSSHPWPSCDARHHHHRSVLAAPTTWQGPSFAPPAPCPEAFPPSDFVEHEDSAHDHVHVHGQEHLGTELDVARSFFPAPTITLNSTRSPSSRRLIRRCRMTLIFLTGTTVTITAALIVEALVRSGAM